MCVPAWRPGINRSSPPAPFELPGGQRERDRAERLPERDLPAPERQPDRGARARPPPRTADRPRAPDALANGHPRRPRAARPVIVSCRTAQAAPLRPPLRGPSGPPTHRRPAGLLTPPSGDRGSARRDVASGGLQQRLRSYRCCSQCASPASRASAIDANPALCQPQTQSANHLSSASPWTPYATSPP